MSDKQLSTGALLVRFYKKILKDFISHNIIL